MTGGARGAEPGAFASPRIFPLLLALLFLTHAPLLRLPYFWDEAGYYIPAARDLLLSGSLIPQTTLSNAHPPLVMAYLALCWKLAGYAPEVTRAAMLVIAAFALLGLFCLGERVANIKVAAVSTLLTGLYPVFFAQSSLAHVDLAAAGLIFWGLSAYVKNQRWAVVVWFSLAALAKETAILAPLALLAWELVARFIRVKEGSAPVPAALGRPEAGATIQFPRQGRSSVLLLIPVVPLTLWYAYHYHRTGFVFGNPEFFHYNVQATLHPLRILLAFLLRLWQTVGYMNLSLLTLAALFAMWLPPLHDEGTHKERPRIALEVQFAFLSIIVVYVLAMSIVGGAVLSRYMLPVVPLVIVVCVSTLWRRVRLWGGVAVVVALGFVAGLFVNPPYGFSIEDNLAYRDYIVLHQHAEQFLEARHPMSRVLTAWPASDELTRPYLGYVTRPMRVVRIENFTVEQLMLASEFRSNYDVALVFSSKHEPPHALLEHWRLWQEWKKQFFGYYRDVPPAAAAQLLGGRLVYTETRKGQWVAVIEVEREYEARVSGSLRDGESEAGRDSCQGIGFSRAAQPEESVLRADAAP